MSAGISAIGSRGMFGLSVGRYDFRYGLPGEQTDPEAGGKIDGLRNDGKVRAELNGNRRFPLITLAGSATSYQHSEIENTGQVATSFNLKTQTVNLTAKSAMGHATGAFGVNGLFKQYGATGDEALTPAADSKGGGVFVYEDIPLSTTERTNVPHLQLGARYDSYNIDSKAGDAKFGSPRSLDFNAFSGSIGITLPLTHTSSLAVSGARAFRAPSVEELFSNAFHAAAGSYDVGNPDLKPETNNGVEAVYRIQSGKIDAQFATYYSAIANYVVPNISSDTTLDSGETVPLNHFGQGDATLKGVEGRIEETVAPHLVVGAMTDVTRGSFRDGGNIPFMPAARIGGHLRWDNGTFSVGSDVKHGLKQDKVTGGAIDVPTDAYTLLGINVGFSHMSGGLVHSVTLRADNLTDARYRDATSRIKSFAYNPGRNFAVVYKVLF
ncbi:MAG: TonB-dependent receptor [Gemmatimonadaceae bacterium]